MSQSFIASILLFFMTILICSCDHSGERNGLEPICGGCVRYVKGFDITGVTNDVVLTIKNGTIKTACDCINKCRQNWKTCANFVWKFTDGSASRTCTLYSNFNLPPNVTIAFDLNNSQNLGVIGSNPQAGGLVPHCQLFDRNGNAFGTDPNCVSGPIWALDNNQLIC